MVLPIAPAGPPVFELLLNRLRGGLKLLDIALPLLDLVTRLGHKVTEMMTTPAVVVVVSMAMRKLILIIEVGIKGALEV